jgi:hypothetical protein
LNYLISKIIEIVNKIILKFNPEKIFLCDFQRSVDPNSKSDLDLLIIQVSVLPSYRRVSELRRLIIGCMIHIDWIVCTPDKVEYEEELNSSFLNKTIKKSKLIYERI